MSTTPGSNNSGGSQLVDLVKFLITKFTTVAHFRRFLATLIFVVGIYLSMAEGKIPVDWIGFMGLVVGYYFGHNKSNM